MNIYRYICESYYETKTNHHETFHLFGAVGCLSNSL